MGKMKQVKVDKPISELSPLDITCKSSRCEENLHSFHLNKTELKKFEGKRPCKDCGADLIDWERVRKRDLKDANFTITSMKKELFRHVFWDNEIEQAAITKAQTFTYSQLKERAKKLIKQKIGKAQNFNEGYQTKKKGDEITHYAQHATGTCCRNCLEYWHDIKIGTDLTEPELEFCADMAMLYIEKKVPNLIKQ
jgi:hypothetical protein